jgi:hypothetical protein
VPGQPRYGAPPIGEPPPTCTTSADVSTGNAYATAAKSFTRYATPPVAAEISAREIVHGQFVSVIASPTSGPAAHTAAPRNGTFNPATSAYAFTADPKSG